MRYRHQILRTIRNALRRIADLFHSINFGQQRELVPVRWQRPDPRTMPRNRRV